MSLRSGCPKFFFDTWHRQLCNGSMFHPMPLRSHNARPTNKATPDPLCLPNVAGTYKKQWPNLTRVSHKLACGTNLPRKKWPTITTRKHIQKSMLSLLPLRQIQSLEFDNAPTLASEWHEAPWTCYTMSEIQQTLPQFTNFLNWNWPISSNPAKTSISCWTMSACLFHHTTKGLRCLPLYCTAHPYNGTNLEDAAWSWASQYCRYSWHVCSQKQIWKVLMAYNFCMDVIDHVYIHKKIYILHTVVARHAHLSASLPAPFGRAAALTTVTTIVEIPQPLPTECSNLQRRSNSHQKRTSSKKPGLYTKKLKTNYQTIWWYLLEEYLGT